MDATARFAEVVGGPDPSIPLDEATLLIAAHARPDLDVAAELARIDDLAAGVREPTLDGLRRHLFADLGFRGEPAAYDDPRGSYLHEVVARRVGLPITLSVLAMEVGRRVGVPLWGVSMPGHFLLRDKVDPEVFVDPYAGGALLDRRGAQARFHAVLGPGATFAPSMLDPSPRLAIVARVLANLEGVAVRRSDRDMLEWVLRLRVALPGPWVDERRRLAALLATSGRVVEAAEVLEALAAGLPGPPGEAATAAARRLRARLN